MGMWYHNIALYGPTQCGIAHYLEKIGQTAIVSPTIRGVTVIFDGPYNLTWESALIPGALEEARTNLLVSVSRHFACPVLSARVLDSDRLIYHLFDRGVCVDEYNSWPNHDGCDEEQEIVPSGGDANALCKAFHVEDRVSEVEKVLRHESTYVGDQADNDNWLGEEYHDKLVEVLIMPSFASRTSYGSVIWAIERGDEISDIPAQEFIEVGERE